LSSCQRAADMRRRWWLWLLCCRACARIAGSRGGMQPVLWYAVVGVSFSSGVGGC